jgi:aspartate kinase
LNVHSNKRTRAQGFLTRVFSILDKWDLSVDLIASSEVHVSMALHNERPMVSMGKDEELKIQDVKLHGAVTDLAELGHVDLSSDMAIVSLVGKGLRNLRGISGRFFSVLGENNINIEMISQGTF